ncbi:MAG: glycosyltransferase [Candidatus Saccharimonadales bacterium]
MSYSIVSVIVPTKNSATTLKDCLESIQSQTYKHIEIIVVDNHSTDTTPEIAKKYATNFYTKGPERSPQRNFGVNHAHGTYIAIIDSDMNLSPEVIAQAIATIEQDSSLSGVVIPEESFGIGFWAQCKKLERSFYLGVPYMEAARFFRRKDFLDMGGYNEKLVSGEDWDLSQRMEELGKPGRIESFIYHNEGHISLWKTVRKKYYYAQKFAAYLQLNPNNHKVTQQTGLVGRYKLYFTQPKKLFKNPLLGISMLFMKTCEFSFGAAGYLKSKVR